MKTAADISKHRPRRPGFVRSAFTLVELMISIALALLLILGVNQVFTYTTQAVGAGEAINSDIRTSRAVQATFAGDLGNIVGNGSGPSDSACLIIGSRAVYAYRNARDMASEGAISTSAPTGFPSNNAAFLDINGDGKFGDPTVPGEVVYPAIYNGRNHRLDCLSFFARDIFHRQTGNLGTYVDNMATTEAWIWYGHLWLPDNNFETAPDYGYSFQPYPATGAYPVGVKGPITFPGAGTTATNPNNYFASQFVLGRLGVLLKEKTLDNATGVIYDTGNSVQRFVDRLNPYPVGGAYATELEPLGSSSHAPTTTLPAVQTNDPSSWYLQDGRFDLAATTIANFRKKLISYLDPNPAHVAAISANPNWYDWMMDGNINPPAGQPFPTIPVTTEPTSTRVKCNPYLAKPADSAGMAQTTPYFVGGCSQFIVEFAGDFLEQDNDPTHVDATGKPSYGSPATHTAYGDVITRDGVTSTPDGTVDFTIVNVATSGAPQYVKQIKWYGMPRSTAGLSTINFSNGDVVPLRDWRQQAVLPGPTGSAPTASALGKASFEQYGPTYQASDYSNGNMTLAEAQTGYTCAFGPGDPRPKLIRITMTLEDPTGRLPDGQTYQYVFQVP